MIKLFATDIDGTLTDGKIYLSEKGDEYKAFSVKDGMGIKLLQKAGVEVAIITNKTSKIVERRATDLGIKEVYQGINDKKECLLMIMKKLNIKPEEVAYAGDDITDIECMRLAKESLAPNDAMEINKKTATFVSTFNGGDGAVRDFIEYLLSL